MNKIALSLGGNIGNVPKTFDTAIAKLAKAGVCEICRSSLYHSEAEECIPDTPHFTNLAITGTWSGTPSELLEICQRIEEESGRPSDHTPGTSRTLDIDIILFGNLIYKDYRLQIPHKNALSRLFVILPLSEIAEEWIFPGKDIKISQLSKELVENRDRKTRIFHEISGLRF